MKCEGVVETLVWGMYVDDIAYLARRPSHPDSQQRSDSGFLTAVVWGGLRSCVLCYCGLGVRPFACRGPLVLSGVCMCGAMC